MALASGTKLGPYEVLSPAGAGGMGEVYRARDTRLDRTVAIKVLPEQYSTNPELRQRFEREARAISGLNDPHICRLYDIGHQDGVDFLVMEYLEGETLSERLGKGRLSAEMLFSVAIEIAGALSTAHRQGIVHRDLKPGNVMLTSGGAKLLDFGLAKPVGIAAAAGSASAPLLSAAATVTSPSPASPLTGQGTIIGTIQYMSPEQIEGKEADARSDIFAFGAMLYEMVTGQRAFTGKSQISVASSILEKDPEPVSRVTPAAPHALDRIVQTCLAKDPEQRFQCAADLKLELEWGREAPAVNQAVVHEAQAAQPWRSFMPWGIAALLAVALAMLGYSYWKSLNAPQHSVHSYILPPEKSAFVMMENHSGPPVISPDGTRMAFTARTPDGQLMLWVQPLNSPSAQALTGTNDAYYPFWSADSHYIGYFGNNKLNKVDANGGPPQALCDAPNGRGGTWNADGTIVFGAVTTAGLKKVSAAGGSPTDLTSLEATETSHRWPAFLPDGKHFVYFAHATGPAGSSIYLASLDSKERTLLVHNDSNGMYAEPGYLLFIRDNTLMAQRFRADKLVLEGDAHPVAAHVAMNSDTWRGIFSSSNTGILLYQHGEGAVGSQLLWYGRDGKLGEPALAGQALYRQPALSPDGKKLAVLMESNGVGDIWIVDLERKTKMRITFGPQYNDFPVWWPDGKSVLFSCGPVGNAHLCRKAADGTGAVENVDEPQPSIDELAMSVSPDGRYVVYMRTDPRSKTAWDIWALSMTDRKAVPVVATEFNDASSIVSPNGKWLVYQSNESGRAEVYVQPFPAGPGRWQVSTNGGVRPYWRGDGKELFFLTPAGEITAVDVRENGGSLELGTPHALFKATTVPATVGPFRPSADGKKFLVNATSVQSASEPLTMITNWTADLAK